MSTKLDRAITRDRVEDRAKRLYESGYRAAPLPDRACIVLMISPSGDPYTLDLAGRTCTCIFFPSNGYCKHILGVNTLLRAQEAAKKRARRFEAEQAEEWREEFRQLRTAEDFAQARRQRHEEEEACSARYLPGNPQPVCCICGQAEGELSYGYCDTENHYHEVCAVKQFRREMIRHEMAQDFA